MQETTFILGILQYKMKKEFKTKFKSDLYISTLFTAYIYIYTSSVHCQISKTLKAHSKVGDNFWQLKAL